MIIALVMGNEIAKNNSFINANNKVTNRNRLIKKSKRDSYIDRQIDNYVKRMKSNTEFNKASNKADIEFLMGLLPFNLSMSANADSDDEKWREKNQNQDAMKLNLINEASLSLEFIFFEALSEFNSLYTSLKLSTYGPCKICAPQRAASRGF